MKSVFIIILILIDAIAFLILLLNLLRYFNNKVILEMGVTDLSKSIYLEKSKYIVSFTGGLSVKVGRNFRIELVNENEKIKLLKNVFRNRFFYKCKKSINYYNFVIEKPGNYLITIYKPEELLIKNSMLYSRRIFEKPKSIDNIKVLFLRMNRNEITFKVNLILIFIIVLTTVFIAISL